MNKGSAAIAVFVKTPGLSPIKTRLADEIGRSAADEFYDLSVAAVEGVVANASRDDRDNAQTVPLTPYWAVAEEDGLTDARWQRFARLWQGDGTLGERLARVIGELQERHAAVVAIGADSPQLSPQHLLSAITLLMNEPREAAHVLGRCHDGGFYLVGTNAALPHREWMGVAYGTSTAADQLAAKLARYGLVRELPQLTDVDRAADLPVLQQELSALTDLSPPQQSILDWLKRMNRDCLDLT